MHNGEPDDSNQLTDGYHGVEPGIIEQDHAHDDHDHEGGHEHHDHGSFGEHKHILITALVTAMVVIFIALFIWMLHHIKRTRRRNRELIAAGERDIERQTSEDGKCASVVDTIDASCKSKCTTADSHGVSGFSGERVIKVEQVTEVKKENVDKEENEVPLTPEIVEKVAKIVKQEKEADGDLELDFITTALAPHDDSVISLPSCKTGGSPKMSWDSTSVDIPAITITTHATPRK